jgi:MFS family permease
MSLAPQPPNGPAVPLGYVALLRSNRNFRRLWLGQVVSQLGDWLDYVALLTLLLQLTGSGTVVAGMLVARFLPTFVISPVAGVAVDRWNRKRIMVTADVCRAVLVLGLLLIGRAEQVWISYVVVALVVSLTAFFEPARTASIPNVTGRDELIVANTLGAVTWSVSLGIGSALGGLVTAVAGWRTAIVLDACSFACSAWLIAGIHLPPTRAAARPLGLAGLLGVRDLIEGARYLRQHPPVASAVLVKSGWSLAGGLVLLHSIFGERVYPVWGSAAAGIGLLAMMRGIGTALGPVAARRLFGTSPVQMARGIGAGFFVAGALYLLFAATTSLPLALVVLAVAHMGGSTLWVFSTTLLQLVVPDALRGRVFAAELALMTLGMTASSFLTGWALDSLGYGPRTLIAVLGALCFLPGVVWLLLQRSRRFRIGERGA